MTIGIVVTSPPPNRIGALKAAVESVNVNEKAATTPGRLRGRVTRKKVIVGLAPRFRAASSNLGSMFLIEPDRTKTANKTRY